MIFVTWDEEKERNNRRKHGISFETAELVFQDPQAWMYQNRLVEGEQRWSTIGWIRDQLIIVIHTYSQENGHEYVRIISARKATPYERKLYGRHKSKTPE